MKKAKRIAAMIGIILIVSMYLLTFISSFYSTSYTKGLFMASIFSTFVIPVLIYAAMLIYRIMGKSDRPDAGEDEEDKNLPGPTEKQ